MQGYYTTKGLALSAKLLAGVELTISRVVGGSGQTQTTAAALSSPCQTLAVNTPAHSGNTAVIPATLTAAQAEEDYALTELGVYANDPDRGEILYKIYKLSEPVDIVAGSRMVLRFYLEETVSEDVDVTVVCSPAGLITETEFTPVRDAVQAVGTVSESVQLEAAALQDYLDALPRLLTRDITINVSGTLDAPLSIIGFYGCGAIMIQGAEGFTVNNQIFIYDCKVSVELYGMTVNAPDSLGSNGQLLTMQNCSRVLIQDCDFTGTGASICVRANLCSFATLSRCAISHFGTAVEATASSIVSVIYSGTAAYSDNTYGAYTYRGGIILLDATIPDLLGGSANVKSGGPIFKYDGTLL